MNYFTINGVKYEKEWLRLDTIYENNKDWLKILVCIGENSIGKTYSVEDMFCNAIKAGEKCVWIRNTREEAIKCVNGWNGAIERNGLKKEYSVSKDGIQHKKSGDWVVPFVYMSSPDTSIPQIENCKYFGWDEFLSGNEKDKFVMEKPFRAIRNLMKRTVRKFSEIKPVMFLIANPHTPEADILSDLGIYIPFKYSYYGNDYISVDKKSGIMVLQFTNISTWSNENLIEQDKYFSTLKAKDDCDYNYLHPSAERIKPEPKRKQLIFNLTIENTQQMFSVFRCFNGKIWVGKYRKFRNSADNFCVSVDEKTNNNVRLIHQIDILDKFSEIWNAVMYDEVFYQSLFVAEKMSIFYNNIDKFFIKDIKDFTQNK